MPRHRCNLQMHNAHFQKKHAPAPISTGFTLVELMIVVVIIGVLAAIAYPSYSRYIQQTRRSDAQAALTQLAADQEKFFVDCNRYADVISPGPRTCPGTLGRPDALSPDRHYLLTVTPGATTGACSGGGAAITCGYTIVANPNGAGTSGRQINNGRLRIDSVGVKRWDRDNNNTFCCLWTDK